MIHLKTAMQEALSRPEVNRSDRVMIQQLLRSDYLSDIQRSVAERTIKKYGIEIKKNTEGRRATLRDDRIYCFGELDRGERKKWDTIPGSMYYREKMSVPINKYSIQALRELEYKLSENILEYERGLVSNGFSSKKVETIQLPPGCEFLPYQKEGITLLDERGGRCLLADAPRVGKTIQSIGYLMVNSHLRPALIVVPATAKIQWQNEIRKWMPGEKCTRITETKDVLPNDGILIINYDILFDYYCQLEDIGFKVIIGDEVQRIKNPSAKRTKAFKYLSGNIPHIIGLSGTPIKGHTSDFFTILNIIDPRTWNNRQHFLDEYCNGRKDPTGKGSSNLDRLHKILKETIMIRRLRSEVWQDMEEKKRVIIPVEIDNRKEYEEAERDLIKYLRETKGNRAAQNAIRSQALAKFNVMKDIAARGKFKQAVDWIEDFIEAEKLVVFAVHRKMVEDLNEKFKDNSVKLYGGMSDKQKDDAVQSFTHNDKTQLFIGNLTAAGVALPLHVADCTLTLELGWVPDDHEQAEDRVINKDKVNTPITAYYMIAAGTVEEDIAAIIDRKSITLSKILDGKEVEEDSLLTVLIEKYCNM